MVSLHAINGLGLDYAVGETREPRLAALLVLNSGGLQGTRSRWNSPKPLTASARALTRRRQNRHRDARDASHIAGRVAQLNLAHMRRAAPLQRTYGAANPAGGHLAMREAIGLARDWDSHNIDRGIGIFVV